MHPIAKAYEIAKTITPRALRILLHELRDREMSVRELGNLLYDLEDQDIPISLDKVG